MTDKVTLNTLTSFTNDSTAVVQTNANSALIQTAFDNTLSRDGTQPNSMNANLDMNSNRILNLTAPISPEEPIRMQDLPGGSTFVFNALPVGGTSGQVLEKNSGTNYDASWKNLPVNTIPVITPQTFGAFADNNSHPVSAQDIANNPQWIGQYGVGVEWDAVGIQEAIYAAYATGSTPGHVTWLLDNAINGKVFIPNGNYTINIPIQMAAQQFEMEWQSRDAIWHYAGGLILTGNSHTSTTIDNVSPTTLAAIQYNINTGVQRFIDGPGIQPGTQVTAIDFVNGKLTLSQATTSSVVGAQFFTWSALFFCDSVAYGTFRNPSFDTTNTLPRCSTNDTTNPFGVPAVEYNASATALWVIDGTGTPAGLLPQELAIYDLLMFGEGKVDVGVSIVPIRGGSGEGSSIQFFNPSVNGFIVAGIQQAGSNAIGNTIFGGDFLGNGLFTVMALSGSISAYNCTFEGQQNSFQTFSPQVIQSGNMTADILTGVGTGLGTPYSFDTIRSEASCLLTGQAGATTYVRNSSNLGADHTDWFANFPFQLSQVITPSASNTQIRSFCLVDTGGINKWDHMNAGTNLNTLTDSSSPGFTTNQWVGYSLHFRFGSNGFTQHYTGGITANTSNTVTFTGSPVSPNANSLYTITGKTGGSAPNWDTFATQNVVYSGGSGITGTIGSSTLTSTTLPSVGQYVVIPLGDALGNTTAVSGALFNPTPRSYAFCAKITAVTPGSPNTITVNRPLARNVLNAGFFYGTGITDGAQGNVWLNIDFDCIRGATVIDKYQGASGRISQTNYVSKTNAGPITRWQRPSTTGQLYPANYGSSTANASNTVDMDMHSWFAVGLNAAVTPLDLTAPMACSNWATLTPTQNITLNAPTPNASGTQLLQEWTLYIISSGSTPFNVTFGTNFTSNGILNTGSVGGTVFIVKFILAATVGNGSWVEAFRAPITNITNLTAGQLHLDTGTKTATAVAGAATLNKMAGIITSESITTAAGSDYTLTLSNTSIAATDQVFASTNLGTSTNGEPSVSSVNPTSNQVIIKVRNIGSAAFNGTITISFMVLKN